MNFTINNFSDKFKEDFINQGGWNKTCPVSIERLSLLKISFLDFQKNIRAGELIVLDVVAKNVIEIFKELLIAEFPINSVNLLDKYGFDDYKSMSDNNSSCFNNRFILPKGERYSIHAYGVAIDINPLENPMISYISSEIDYANIAVYPEGGKNYLNRANYCAVMVEPIVEIFYRNGFDIWGGLWNEPVDYHHFEVNRKLAEKLTRSSKEEAEILWSKHLLRS